MFHDALVSFAERRDIIMENKNAQNNNIKSKNIEDKNTGNNNTERKNIKDKNNKATRGIITAAAGTFFCNVIFAFLAVRTLGPALVSQSEWSVIKMMQLIRMPGGFLERFDILPIIFWILCMIAVLSGYLYYSWALCRSMINCYGRDFDRKRLNYCGKDSARSMLNPYNRNSNQDLINNSSINDRYLSDVQNEKYIRLWFAGIAVICLLFLSYLVEKNTFLWTYYLKYKAFVDFPLSLILPVVVYIFKGKKENSCEYREKEENKNGKKERGFEYREKVNEKKEPVKKERKNNLVKNEKNEIEKASVTKYFSGAVITLFLLIVFSLTGCQRLTDVEEKSYILSMYVDCPSDKEKVEGDTEKNTCEFWLARANLRKMEEQSDEIPCQITKNKSQKSAGIRRKIFGDSSRKNRMESYLYHFCRFIDSGRQRCLHPPAKRVGQCLAEIPERTSCTLFRIPQKTIQNKKYPRRCSGAGSKITCRTKQEKIFKVFGTNLRNTD